jgi:cytochrome c peroxidase
MALSLVVSGLSAGTAWADNAPAPLKTVVVPQPTGGDIIDQAAAVRLGKALFWDRQTGGDGMIACATCHYNAGADGRLKNTVHPGPDGLFQGEGVTGPGQTIKTLTNITTDDRVGSQGIVGSIFISVHSVDPKNPAADECIPNHTEPFVDQRRVTGRNAPTVIGAVFNRDNFWDGRANHTFNGLDPFGATANAGGTLVGFIGNSSLASQADGPPNNPTEMSCEGRQFNGGNSLAAKLLDRPALQFQLVHPNDSALGSHSAAPANGLKCNDHTCTYRELIAEAFGGDMAAGADNKFSHIWGQAIQAYEATLIPDQTPMDHYLAGDKTALTSSQQLGLNILSGKGKCTTCHAGAELTDASLSFAAQKGLINEDGGDQGFHNNGVRPTAEDPGRAGTGPNGVSFSQSGSPSDSGAFKTPSLRNVGLTSPYFHNGGKATLEDVVDFYNRGGDFANPEKAKRIRPLSLSAKEKTALVDLLKNGLTDCRVEMEQAPFDHPSLDLPNSPSLPAVGAAGVGACP